MTRDQGLRCADNRTEPNRHILPRQQECPGREVGGWCCHCRIGDGFDCGCNKVDCLDDQSCGIHRHQRKLVEVPLDPTGRMVAAADCGVVGSGGRGTGRQR